MRRSLPVLRSVLLTFVLFTSSACGNLGEEPSGVAARVEGWELTVDRLAELLVMAQPFPLKPEEVAPIVRVWVDLAALTIWVARGDSIDSDEMVLQSAWNEVRQGVLSEFRAEEFGSRIGVHPEDLDTLYHGDEVRAVAHVLRRAGPEATQEQRREQYALAREVRRRLVEGGPWEEANQLNQDLDSRENGGLMLLRRDQNLPQITEVAFSLLPGELSEVFASPDGYHILVRPRLEEVRYGFANLLAAEEAAVAESDFVEALAIEKGLDVLPHAPEILRRVAADPLAEVDNSQNLAVFTGGKLTAGQAARDLYLLPPEVRPELIEGPDWGLADFARQLALQELLWTYVEGAGFELSDSAFAVIRDEYLADLAQLWLALEIGPEALTLKDLPLEQRESAAIRNVDLYLETVVGRVKPLRNVPVFLAIQLLQGVDWEIRPAGIREAISAASRLLDLAGYENPG